MTVKQQSRKKYRIYEDEDSLPLGYTYDSWIPREKYEKLSVTEKQQALLQGAVLEDSSAFLKAESRPLMIRKQILHWKQEKAVRLRRKDHCDQRRSNRTDRISGRTGGRGLSCGKKSGF